MAAYRATVAWPDGSVTDETFAACTGSLPDGTLHLDDGRRAVAVWRFPFDPDLPGLAKANDETAMAELLSDLGLGGGPVRCIVRAYRPRRRAVIEVRGPKGRVFVKVLRPKRVEQLHQRHRLLVANDVPAPHSLGWTDDGLLVLQSLPGPTLRDAIFRNAPVPPGAAILAMLDRLPEQLIDSPWRSSWLERVDHYADVAAAIVPEHAQRVLALAATIRAEAGVGPTVPVHGDFYEAQLIVDGPSITGLLDVDGAGPGDRLDDLGCLLGHLSVLAAGDPERSARINEVGAEYLASFDLKYSPADLRYRTAAVVVSLLSGPHRVQDPNWEAATVHLIDLAERWLASAQQAAGRR